jgi:hypothetical protein
MSEVPLYVFFIFPLFIQEKRNKGGGRGGAQREEGGR